MSRLFAAARRRAAAALASPVARWSSLVLLLALYASSGLYFVAADQQGVVVLLGRAQPTPAPPGLHWRWPPPISKVLRLRTQEARRLTVGFEAPEQILGRTSPPLRAQVLTGDRNIVLVRLTVQYAVVDPHVYLFAVEEPERLLRTTVEHALARVITRRRVDDLLTTEKAGVQQSVQRLAQDLLDDYGAGITVLAANLEQVAPPPEVREAFNDVASAREDRDRIVREAESYANQVLPVARGDATRLLSEADAQREHAIQRARGQSASFAALAAEDARAPRATRTRLYLETLDEVLPQIELTVLDADSGSVDLDFVRPRPLEGN